MEGCEACLIDASEVVLFGWLGKCGVKTSPSYPIPFHSRLLYIHGILPRTL